jgi:hypothetical protein
VVEVEDNGLGMDDDERNRRNTVLSDPPDFEAMALKGDPRLGLFVVARLAARHGIKVELRSSSYGGTRAIVLIPATLLVDDEQEDTTVLNRVPSARTPDPDFVDDVLPFRVSLFMPADSSAEGSAEAGTQAGTRVDERVEPREEPEPLWPQQEVVEPHHPRNAQHASSSVNSVSTPAAEPPAGTSDKPALPRRRRQASLAPQLKDTRFAPMEPEDDDPDDGRSPEEIRGIMSAFQHQSRRARDEDQ